MPTTLVRNAAWAIAWDAARGRHVYARDVDVAFTDDRITHVGPGFAGEAGTVIDGAGLMVMPGLVDIHAHPQSQPVQRGLREEHGVRHHYMTGLYERMQAFGGATTEDMAAGFEAAACELLLSGVTTLCDIGVVFPGWTELFARSGLRGFLAPSFGSGTWKLEVDHRLDFAWDEAAGREAFDRTLAFLDELAAEPSGRLTGVVSPTQIENCTGDLLRDAFDAARERNIPYTFHAAQGVWEVQEMLRRHGRTPVQWAHDLGVLAPGTILGHAMFLDRHSWINWCTDEDLGILADSGTAVAHCPTPFSRYSHLMENFGDYVRAGVTMGIGTDCSPHNMIEEMRKVSTFARIAGRDVEATSLDQVFHAATVGGASALLRDDIGRLAPGMKADIVLVDLANPWMRPAHDPLRSLVFHAADRAVRDVFVDGRQLVAEGRVLSLDHADACDRLDAAQARWIEGVPARDFRGRTAEEICPRSLPF
ncbi:amidohydrolase family protein [uncultured Albimonas sp.]|uniref:amidohydrolase family protein n=1 Tax=uncultured Albimonas sp. TaxID=1331701 RepID=UPI0030EEFFE6